MHRAVLSRWIFRRNDTEDHHQNFLISEKAPQLIKEGTEIIVLICAHNSTCGN